MVRVPVTIVALCLCVSGCAPDDKAPATSQPPAASGPPMAVDAAPEPGQVESPSPPERARIDRPAEEFHLDDSGPAEQPRPSRPANRESRMIHITLKSTPSGAMAAVDGINIGRTPAYWEGEATGLPREFTFVLPGHAMGRYRFVPTTSGIVHATLTKVMSDGREVTNEPAPQAP